MLVGKRISKKFGKIIVLNDININIENGKIVSIFGKSGAGKSTLLYILSTLDLPDKGDVFFNEKNLNKLKGDKLWISAANPAVNKYGDWPSAVYGIFIIGPGLRYAMRVDPNNKDNKTRMLTKRFIIIWHPQIFLIPFGPADNIRSPDVEKPHG